MQEKQLAAFAGRAARRLPEGLDYSAIRTLSKESREKLAKVCLGPLHGLSLCALRF